MEADLLHVQLVSRDDFVHLLLAVGAWGHHVVGARPLELFGLGLAADRTS